MRLYCFKREGSDGTVSTTTESEFKSLSLSKLVVRHGDWELELVAMITATVSVSEIHVFVGVAGHVLVKFLLLFRNYARFKLLVIMLKIMLA